MEDIPFRVRFVEIRNNYKSGEENPYKKTGKHINDRCIAKASALTTCTYSRSPMQIVTPAIKTIAKAAKLVSGELIDIFTHLTV